MSQSDYELWVRGLRAWGDDPSHDLSGLPSLTAQSFSPATYQRLIRHLHLAISQMMQTWSADLQRAVSDASDEYAMARELVRVRGPLARRVQLAKHPGLPTEISQALDEQTRKDITTMQQELERTVMKSSNGSTSSRTSNDRLLAVIRQNKLTAVLDPNFRIPAPSTSLITRAETDKVERPAGRRRIYLEPTPTDG